MDFKPLSGSCLCGTIRYTLNEPAKSVEHCHCSHCRRAHGALYASGGLYNRSAVKVTDGKENIQRFESSPGNRREFCQTCGCHLFMTVDAFPQEIYVWVASIEAGEHPGHPAEKDVHIFVGSKAPWETLPQEITQFDQMSDTCGIGQA